MRGPYGPHSGSLSRRILELLLERGQLRSREIAEELGVTSSRVSRYLSYWRKRGVVRRLEGGFWELTELGVRLLAASSPTGCSSGTSSGSSSTTGSSSGSTGSGGSLEELLGELLAGLDPEEREVIGRLLAHYRRWGSTYTYLDELAGAMRADPQWLLSVARRLQAKQLLYIYRDRELWVRIGLGRRLREHLLEKKRGGGE